MAWTDYADDVGIGALSGAATGAALGSFVPIIGTGLGAAAGGLIGGIGGWFSERDRKKNANSAENLIKQFAAGHKDPLSPALRARAQRLAMGGQGVDPQMQRLARAWAAGEGGISYDTNLANQMLRGDIPPSMAAAMDRRIGNRFDTLRRQQGGQLARTGVLRSSAGGRLMADTYDSERNALTDTYMNTMLQRQGLGLNILGAANADLRARQMMGASELGRQADRDMAYQRLGFSMLTDPSTLNRDSIALNARLGLLGQQQVRRDATLESAGNLLSGLYTNYQDQQRFDKLLSQQNNQFSQLMGLSSGGGGGKISPIMAKANLSAVQLGGGNILGSRDPFKLLSQQRTGAGGYGARNTPLTSRY